MTGSLSRHDATMLVGVTDESNHISYPGLMANVFSDDLVEVWVCIGVANSTCGRCDGSLRTAFLLG